MIIEAMWFKDRYFQGGRKYQETGSEGIAARVPYSFL